MKVEEHYLFTHEKKCCRMCPHEDKSMKYIFSFAILLCLTSVAAQAQTDKSKEIRAINEHYAKVTEQIEKIEMDEEAAFESDYAVNELVVNKLNKSWPAVGNYSVVYRFYYKQVGEQPYPDQLVMVKKQTVSAARKYFEEYLFGDDGSFVFMFYKGGPGEEFRLYFSSDKLIKDDGLRDKFDRAAMLAQASNSKEYIRLFILSIQ